MRSDKLQAETSPKKISLIGPAPTLTAGGALDDPYYRLVEDLPVAIYITDTHGRVTMFNRQAADLWGREPRLGEDMWCGSWKIFLNDGVTPLSLDACPMAVAVRERRAVVGEEILIERPDGSRRSVLPHPRPLYDGNGGFIGAINMVIDITDRRQIEHALRESEYRFRTMFNQAAVGICIVDGEGRLLEVNDRMCQIVDRSEEELVKMTCQSLTHPDDWAGNIGLVEKVHRRELHEFSIEKRYLRRDGSGVWVNVSVTPLHDDSDRPHHLVAIVEDITERRFFNAELQRQVTERTAELEHAHRQLRERERLAAMGALSAGLGHDLANLIMPLRAHLDAMAQARSPEDLAVEIDAVRRGLDYLRRLSVGLRQMAVDITDQPPSHEYTDLSVWWGEAEGVFKAALGRGMRLQSKIPADLPLCKLGKTQLTQAIFNLVQNAAEALAGRPGGQVCFWAERDPAAAGSMRIGVTDNGPGMEPEVLSRCFEPYFSTKGPSISTGMGLGFVRSVIMSAGGSVSAHSTVGDGASLTITVPSIERSELAEGECIRAVLGLDTPRQKSVATAVFDAIGVKVCTNGDASQAQIWVATTPSMNQISEFLGDSQSRCVILWQDPPAPEAVPAAADAGRIIYCGCNPDTLAIRSCFKAAARLVASLHAGKEFSS